jgi:hypothetical protein
LAGRITDHHRCRGCCRRGVARKNWCQICLSRKGGREGAPLPPSNTTHRHLSTPPPPPPERKSAWCPGPPSRTVRCLPLSLSPSTCWREPNILTCVCVCVCFVCMCHREKHNPPSPTPTPPPPTLVLPPKHGSSDLICSRGSEKY